MGVSLIGKDASPIPRFGRLAGSEMDSKVFTALLNYEAKAASASVTVGYVTR